MNTLQYNQEAASSRDEIESEPSVADYLREHPALVLTMLDIAERYARAAESHNDNDNDNHNDSNH